MLLREMPNVGGLVWNDSEDDDDDDLQGVAITMLVDDNGGSEGGGAGDWWRILLRCAGLLFALHKWAVCSPFSVMFVFSLSQKAPAA